MAQILIFTPANVACPTNVEWQAYTNEVDLFHHNLIQQVLVADPNAQVPAVPSTYAIHPTAPTARLNGVMQATQWLAGLQHQLATLQAADVPQDQPAAPPTAPTINQPT
jgi:hypothetical protein